MRFIITAGITMALIASTAVGANLRVSRSGTGALVSFEIPASEGSRYELEKSEDLMTWTSLNTVQGALGATGLRHDPGLTSRGFYRLRKVLEPPKVTAQSYTRGSGDLAMLTVTFTGTAPFTYQWFRNGLKVANATNWAWAFPVTSASAGSYVCEIKNTLGQATSAALMVPAPVAPPPPVIEYAPASIAGKTIEITVTSGSGLFARSGQYLFLPDKSTYRIAWVAPANPNSGGTYTYTRLTSSSARLSVTDSVVGIAASQTLTFQSAAGGTFTLTGANGAGSQSGRFTIR